MPLSQSELLDLVDEVNAAVAEAIANFAQLKEGMVDDVATNSAKEKVERLKRETQTAKERLSTLQDRQRHRREVDRQRHRREVDRQRKERERQSAAQTNESKSGQVALLTALRAANGKVLGYVRKKGSATEWFFPSGRFAGREIGNTLYDETGRVVSYQKGLGAILLARGK